MKRSIRTIAALLAVACPLAAAPLHAQLHGDWPSDPHWRDAGDVSSPRPEHMALHGSNNALGVPRGDLRKDVADASHDALRNRAR